MMITNYLKSLIITSLTILLGSLLITLFNYFNILNGLLLEIIESIIPIIAIFVGSYLIGKSSSKKGYIEGIKYSSIWVLIFLIINIIAKNINLLDFVYFIIMILFSALASMIGINRKKE